MKKIFSLFIALMAVMAINATDYFISGINGSWNEPGSKAELLLVPGTGSVRTVAFTRIDAGSEFKIFANSGWGGPEYGAANAGDAVEANGAAYTMATPAQNLKIGGLAEGHYLANAVISVDTAAWTVTVAGTDVDGTAEPDVYCLVGGCTDNWSPTAAVEFVDVNGVLTATVADLNGTFKIIKNHKWGWEAGAPAGAQLNFNEDFTCTTTGGGNISFANPFAGYLNAVVTLDITNADAPVIKVIGGTFKKLEADWYIAGTKTGWSCGDDQKMTKLDDTHYEFLAAEFNADFKVVYGNWLVEYGVAKTDSVSKWAINTPMNLVTPCGNIFAAEDVTYEDVTITITVDYEAATVQLLVATEQTALNDVEASEKAIKRIVNGQLVIEKNGVRYNALGAVIE